MEYYLKHEQNIDMDRVPNTSERDKAEGQALLTVNMYYSKDSRQRGLKLSINRSVRIGPFTSTALMSKYNGLVHIHTMARKNDKIGKAWATVLETLLPSITVIAMESDEPDWTQIADLLMLEKA